MEWSERLTLIGALAIAIGMLWRAYLAKDAALSASQHARIDDLKEIVRRSSEED